MVSQKVIVHNETGVHLRPAAVLCEEAQKFKADIHFNCNGKKGNAKSVLSLLGCGVKNGYEIEFICEGEDEKEALEAIIRLVNDDFDKQKE